MIASKPRNSNAALVGLCLAAALAGCGSVPTLAQRQDAWRAHMRVQKLTCAAGLNTDLAMPDDVAAWCARVVAP